MASIPIKIPIFAFLASAVFLAGVSGAEDARVPNFRLMDQTGLKPQELHWYADQEAVVLIVQGNGCPIFRKSIPEILALRRRFADRRVVFLMINANSQDTRESVAEEAKEFGLDLPILLDESQVVAESLGLSRTAEALLIDPKGWRIVYRGAIDDRLNYGAEKPVATKRYLQDALESLLSGRRPIVEKTEAFGCLISWGKRNGASFVKEAGPILRTKCLGCHWDPRGPAPMASFEKARGWAPMIRETLLTHRMPPWSADPLYGKFTDDISLTQEELRTLLHWINAGTPRDAGEDPLAAFKPPPREEWPMGKPDILLSMDKFEVVPATGALAYQYFQVAGPLEKDLWITAVDIRPGNGNVVHHAFLMDYPKPQEFYQRNAVSGEMSAIRYPEILAIGSWHPGRVPTALPAGVAIRVPRGHSLVLEIHYSPSGREEKDKTTAALYLYHGKNPPQSLKSRRGELKDFVIPPNTRRFSVGPIAVGRFEKDAYLVNFRPHMHYRGVGMKAFAIYPDGRKETLLSISKYDFNWQYIYTFVEPKFVPAGTRISVKGVFDNSKFNPANPDPNKEVVWGLGTSDEMFFFSVSYFDAVAGSRR